MTVTKSKTKKSEDLIIQNITISQVQRSSQDIQKWRQALQAADSITLPRRTLLYDLYDDILLDAHLSSVINKRISAITKKPIIYIDKNGVEVPEISQLCQTEVFYNMVADIMWSRFWGHSLFDFTPVIPTQQKNLSTYQPINYTLIPRKHVIPEKGWIIKMQSDSSPMILFRELPFTNFICEAGKPDDRGLLLKAAPYIIYKRGGLADWAQYSEIFGMPIRVGKYDGYDEQTRIQLNNALLEAGSASHIVIPEGSNIEFVESKSASGSTTLYSDFINTCNSEISKLILGNTLTTEQGDKGARSLGDVHKEVEEDINKDDELFCQFKLNNEIRNILINNGLNLSEGQFKFNDTKEIPLDKRIDLDVKINNIAPIDPEYFYETYGRPKSKVTVQPVAGSQNVVDTKNNKVTNLKNKKRFPTPPLKRGLGGLNNFYNSVLDFFSSALLK